MKLVCTTVTFGARVMTAKAEVCTKTITHGQASYGQSGIQYNARPACCHRSACSDAAISSIIVKAIKTLYMIESYYLGFDHRNRLLQSRARYIMLQSGEVSV